MYGCQSNNELEKLIDLITIADEAGVSDEDWFVKDVEKLSVRWDNFRFQKLIAKCVRSQGFLSLLDQTWRFPKTSEEKKAIKGDFQIGKIAGTDIPVGLTRRALNLHTLIAGQTGFGKTSVLNVLSDSIQKEGKILQWFIDPKTRKFDFRWLVKAHTNFILLPLDILRLNPFGSIIRVPKRAILETNIQTFADTWNVFDAGQGVIAKHCKKIFEQNEKPCFQDFADSLLSELKSTKYSRRQGYLETLDVRVTLNDLSLQNVFGCREDYFNELYDKNVIFEIGGISDFAQKVLVPFIIMKLSLYKTYNPTE